jgi:acyl-CoA synthetase (AMP-forming)/AMP-acid ligase II
MSEATDQPYGDGVDARRGQTTETRLASVVEALVRHAERTPHKLCLLFEGEQWSYGRLRERAETFAATLRTWGPRPGDRVALFLGNCPDFQAVYLGTHLAGGVVVPVNTQYRKVELRHILADAGVRLCFTDEERRPELERGDLPDLEAVIEAGRELQDFVDDAEPSEPHLAGYKRPRRVVFVEALPRNAMGKVLKHEVRDRLIVPEE